MKEIFAEQPPGKEYWNVWLLDGEKKESIAQINENDSMNQIEILRNQIVKVQGISLSQGMRELKKIINWKMERLKASQPKRQVYFEDKTPIGEILEEKAQTLMNQFTLRTIEDTKEIFYYQEDQGIYIPAERMLESIIQTELKEKATNHNVNEILGRIQRGTYIPRDRSNNPNHIPLKNGIFDVEKQTVMEFSPDYFFTSKHPIEYDSLAHCPKINQFIGEICEGEIEKIWLLEKMIAYCFYRDYPIQQAFMLLGSGSNGKSTLLNLLTEMLGEQNVSNVGLQDFEKNRFAISNLHLKNANIYSDISSESLKDPTMFKALTGGDTVLCDQKFKQPFRFDNFAKLIFSCNQLPESKDDSDAFFRRWVIIEFKKKFEYSQQKRNLLKELVVPSELNGLFVQIMPKLKSMVVDGEGITDESTNEVRKRYQRNANSSNAFAIDCLDLDAEAQEEKPKIWGAYQSYCRENHLQVIANEDRFWKSIHSYFGDKIYDVRLAQPITKERIRGLRGIRLIQSKGDEENKEMSLIDKILQHMKRYNGPNSHQVPIDFVMSCPSDDVLAVRDMVFYMKRNGYVYEMPSGYLQIDTSIVKIQTKN